MRSLVGYGFTFTDMQNQPIFATIRNFSPGFKSTHHMHDYPQLWYCYKGHYFHQIDDRIYECRAGSLVVLPIATAHQFWVDTETELMYMNISYDLLKYAQPGQHNQSIANLFLPAFFTELDLSFSPYQVLSTQSRQVFEKTFSWFAMLNYAPSNTANETQLWDKLEEMFSIAEYAVSCKNWEKATRILQTRIVPILKIVAYLNCHYPEKITDEMLLREANISRTAMYRYFKLILGKTYSQYLQYLRTRHAHVCLRDTTYSLSDIAELCGFYDSYHMSRVYSKCVGITISKQRMNIKRCREERLKSE